MRARLAPSFPLLPVACGLLLAAFVLTVASVTPASFGVFYLGVNLALGAAKFLDLTLRDGRRAVLVTEFTFAALTVALAVGGSRSAPWLLGLGYFLDGGWTLLHTLRRPAMLNLPEWYVPTIVAYTWPVAAYILRRWA